MTSKRHLPVVDTGQSFDELLSGVIIKDDLGTTPPRIVPPVVTKEYISYSEIVTWLECAHRHKLKYIDQISLDGPSEHTEFGQVIHDALEEFLITRTMPDAERVKEEFNKRLASLSCAPQVPSREWQDVILPMLTEVPVFLDMNFPNWEYVGAEQELMEDISGQKRRFKGFIDGIIKVPKKARKGSKTTPTGYDYVLLDWKTTSWGWPTSKKIDPNKTLQLVLYKYFWAKKLGVDLKDVRCHFVLLKRTSKKEHCELVTVSVGDKAVERGLDTINQMLGYIKKGFFPKNRDNCKWCVYAKTPHCP